MEEERVDEGYVREWAPCTRLLSLLPPRVQAGLFSTELRLTCLDAVSDYLALGTNVGLVYWYNRKHGGLERLRCEANQSSITYVKIANTVDYMVAAGNTKGEVTIFQIPKELPESVPDALRPKTEPKVERYTVGELHQSPITAIEWSKNGMRLFSGDKNGVIIMTEIDFYMHLCKSVEIVNEQYEIVQISYHQNSLLVSSMYRTIVCERGETKWTVNQVGKKERKSLCSLGAVFQWSYAPGAGGAGVAAYCARPGLRLWRADKSGEVHQTLLFKDAVANPSTVAELLNPCQTRHAGESQFGPLHVFRERLLVTHSQHLLYILDPRSLTARAVVDGLRRILSVAVNNDEIFVLEGERSVVRLGCAPESHSHSAGVDPLDIMTKSLTTSIQMAVNTVKELANVDVLSSMLDTEELQENAEECFELPPVKELPPDIAINVLESMIGSFEHEEIIEDNISDLQKKVKLYNMIAQPRNSELIYSSKRSKKMVSSANNTPKGTPVRKIKNNDDGFSYTSPCIMPNDCLNKSEESDEEIKKQIEEKEKILAKMLNLDSLSISYKPEPLQESNGPELNQIINSPNYRSSPIKNDLGNVKNYVSEVRNEVSRKGSDTKNDLMTRSYPTTARPARTAETVPKMAKVPPNWNLGSLMVDEGPSPDTIEGEWEFV